MPCKSRKPLFEAFSHSILFANLLASKASLLNHIVLVANAFESDPLLGLLNGQTKFDESLDAFSK